MNIDYKAIGVRIKAARARKGVTQGYIAEVTGLSTPHISNIETGNTKLGLPTIIHLANVLDVSVDDSSVIIFTAARRFSKMSWQNYCRAATPMSCI